MLKDHENIPLLDLGPSDGPELQRFAPDQMVQCEKCQRFNPPTRTNCIYCGAPFAFDEQKSKLRKPELRPLETWEQGFSVVCHESSLELSHEQKQVVASLLKITPELLTELLEFGKPLPLACVATAEEAMLIVSRLKDYDIKAAILADADLGIHHFEPTRIRSLELGEERLLAHPLGGGQSLSLDWSDVVLLVQGTILITNLEFLERKGGRRDGEIVDTSETFKDEAVLDIYPRNSTTNFRVMEKSFDFSCLGRRKTLLAYENFRKLQQLISERAPDAVFDDSYKEARRMLQHSWSATKSTQSRGLRRERPGKSSIEAVTKVTNESQFTRYSRLVNYLQQHSKSK